MWIKIRSFATPRALIAMLALAALVAGCVYRRPERYAGWFSEQRIAHDYFRVRFEGNTYGDWEELETEALEKAAEVTLNHGFKYFAIIKGHGPYDIWVAQINSEAIGDFPDQPENGDKLEYYDYTKSTISKTILDSSGDPEIVSAASYAIKDFMRLDRGETEFFIRCSQAEPKWTISSYYFDAREVENALLPGMTVRTIILKKAISPSPKPRHSATPQKGSPAQKSSPLQKGSPAQKGSHTPLGSTDEIPGLGR